MISPSLYLFSKKIHRVLMIIIIVLTILMASTGILLKYTFIASQMPFVDLGLIRYIHNAMSPIFTIALGIMMLTGIIMYLFPLQRK